VHVGYLAANGYGSFKLQYKVNGAGSWIDATSASITSGGGSVASGVVNSNNSGAERYCTARIALPLADAYHLRIVATTGRVRLCHVLGNMGAMPTSQLTAGQGNFGGALSVRFDQGGRGIGTHFSQWSESVLVDAFADIAPQIIVYKSANQWTLTNYQTLWPALTAKLAAAAPNALLVVCGSHPRGSNPTHADAGDTEVDEYLRQWCATQNGAIFVDVRQSFPAYLAGYASSTSSTDDLWSDGIHLYGEAGGLADGNVWVRALVFESIRPALDLYASWKPASSIGTVLPSGASEVRLFNSLTSPTGNPHHNRFTQTVHPRMPSASVLRPASAFYNGGAGLFDGETGYAATATSASNPFALTLLSAGQHVMTFGHRVAAGSPPQGLCVGVGSSHTTNSARAQNGYRFRVPWAIYGVRSGLIAEGRDDSPADMRLLGVDINSTDAAAGASLWSWYPGGSVAYHGLTNDAFETTFTYAEPTADTTIHTPVCSTAGSGARVRSVAVVGSYLSKAAGEAAVEVGEVFFDEGTGKTLVRLV
jgi:hypothetical protein